MASLTQWTWIWVNSRSRWWTGRPGVLQYMGLQRVGHAEWLNWTELNWGTLRNFLPHQNVNFCMHLLYQYGPLASYLTAIITCHNPWPSFISMLILSLIWPGEPLQASFYVTLACPHHSLRTFLVFGVRCSNAHLLFLLQPEIRDFSHEPLF